MIKIRVKISNALKRVRAIAEEQLHNLIVENTRAIVYDIHTTVHEITPVWSGRAVANFQWANDAPSPVRLAPVASGEKGDGRREENARLSDMSLRNLDYTRKIVLTNNAIYRDGHTYEDLEYGRLPTPEKTRVPPQGIMRLAMARYPSKIVIAKI
jgi:hypothetical protein